MIRLLTSVITKTNNAALVFHCLYGGFLGLIPEKVYKAKFIIWLRLKKHQQKRERGRIG
jgi:hypothetical protein